MTKYKVLGSMFVASLIVQIVTLLVGYDEITLGATIVFAISGSSIVIFSTIEAQQ